jgi:NADH:ubiquinone oxidoreductase subunit K
MRYAVAIAILLFSAGLASCVTTTNTVYINPSGEVVFTSVEVPSVLLIGDNRIPSNNSAINGSIQIYGIAAAIIGLVYWLPRRDEGHEDVLMDEFEDELEFG